MKVLKTILILLIGQIATAQITLTDILASTGVGEIGPNYDVAFGNYDNDGWEDIYITRRPTANHLYLKVPNSWLHLINK